MAKKYGVRIATKAAQALKDGDFNDLNIQQLMVMIHPENITSKKIASKVVMRLIKKTIFQGIDVAMNGVTHDR